MGARYINADLILESPFDLSELSAELGQHGLFVLDAKGGRVTLETSRDSEILDHTLDAILRAIESLGSKGLELWTNCSKREIDIGFEKDPSNYATQATIDPALLKRMVAVGASLTITHYR